MTRLNLFFVVAFFLVSATFASAQTGCLTFQDVYRYSTGVEAGTSRAELQRLQISNTCFGQRIELTGITIRTNRTIRQPLQGWAVADSTYITDMSPTQGRLLSKPFDVPMSARTGLVHIALDQEFFIIPANGVPNQSNGRFITIYVAVPKSLVGVSLASTVVGYEARPIESTDPPTYFSTYAPSADLNVLAPGKLGFETPAPLHMKVSVGGTAFAFNLHSITAGGFTLIGTPDANGGIFSNSTSGGITPGGTAPISYTSWSTLPPGKYIGVIKITGNSSGYDTIQVPYEVDSYTP